MVYEELNKKKMAGDFVIVSKMLDMPQQTVQQTFKRRNAKKHQMVCDALQRVIENREQLFQDELADMLD